MTSLITVLLALTILAPRSASAEPTRILLARHGASAFDPAAPVTRATPDPGLSEAGRGEAERLADLAASEGVTEIFSSPFLRARQTAETVGRKLGLRVTVVPEFAEFNLGDLMGRDWSRAPYREQLAAVLADPDGRRPGGESFRDLFSRATRAFRKVLAKKGEKRTILIIAHGITNRAILGHVRGLTIADALALESQRGGDAWFFTSDGAVFSKPSKRLY